MIRENPSTSSSPTFRPLKREVDDGSSSQIGPTPGISPIQITVSTAPHPAREQQQQHEEVIDACSPESFPSSSPEETITTLVDPANVSISLVPRRALLLSPMRNQLGPIQTPSKDDTPRSKRRRRRKRKSRRTESPAPETRSESGLSFSSSGSTSTCRFSGSASSTTSVTGSYIDSTTIWLASPSQARCDAIESYSLGEASRLAIMSSASSPVTLDGSDTTPVQFFEDRFSSSVDNKNNETTPPTRCLGLYLASNRLESKFARRHVYGAKFTQGSIMMLALGVIDFLLGALALVMGAIYPYTWSEAISEASAYFTLSGLFFIPCLCFMLLSQCIFPRWKHWWRIGEVMMIPILVAQGIGFEFVFFTRTSANYHVFGAGIAGFSISVVFMPFRATAAIINAVVNGGLVLVVHCIVPFYHQGNKEVSSVGVVVNIGLTFMVALALIPKLTSLARSRQIFRNELVTKQLKKQLIGHHQKVSAILKHIICPKYHCKVLGGETIVDATTDITAVHLDLVGFTRWVGETNGTKVVDVLNRLFTAFDRVAVHLNLFKLWQAGDGWAAISFPHVGALGRRKIVKLASQALLTIIRDVNKLFEVELKLRAGVSHSLKRGYIVVWGTTMKSLDFYGEILTEAVALEHSGLEGGIHVRQETFERLVQDGLLRNSVGEKTDNGVCFRPRHVRTRGIRKTPSAAVTSVDNDSCLEDVSQQITLVPPMPVLFHRTGEEEVGKKEEEKEKSKMKSTIKRITETVVLGARTMCADRKFLVSGIQTLSSSLARLLASFLMVSLLFVDLLASGELAVPLQDNHIKSLITAGVPCLGAFVYLLSMFLMVVCWKRHSVFISFATSIAVLSLRPLVAIPCFLLYEYPREVFVRYLIGGTAPFLLHPHIPYIIPFMLSELPVPVLAVFQAWRRLEWFYEPDTLFDAITSLAVCHWDMTIFLLASNISTVHQYLTLKKSKRALKERMSQLRQRKDELTLLISSFLPPHCQEKMFRGEDPGKIRVRDAGVLFVRIVTTTTSDSDSDDDTTTAATTSTPAVSMIQTLNEQMSALDLVVSACPFMYKVKSIQQAYFCVCRGASLKELLGFAQELLMTLVDSSLLSLCIGVHVGDFVAGIIGEERWCWDCVGPAINESSRLADSAPLNAICLMERVADEDEEARGMELFDKDVFAVERDQVELKGVGKINVLYLLMISHMLLPEEGQVGETGGSDT